MSATIEELRSDYDWGQVFGYARVATLVRESAEVPALGFSIDDVASVIATVDGDNDGPDWVGVFHLKNGSFGVVRAWCDYTGWGCQEGGSSEVSADLPTLVRLGLSEEERARLGLAGVA